jgi:hypothetical protein
MAFKYYTQFILTDEAYQGRNEFSGVVELNRPMEDMHDPHDIELLLAQNFDLDCRDVKLLTWSRLH